MVILKINSSTEEEVDLKILLFLFFHMDHKMAHMCSNQDGDLSKLKLILDSSYNTSSLNQSWNSLWPDIGYERWGPPSIINYLTDYLCLYLMFVLITLFETNLPMCLLPFIGFLLCLRATSGNWLYLLNDSNQIRYLSIGFHCFCW